jgi:hypothetical protein
MRRGRRRRSLATVGHAAVEGVVISTYKEIDVCRVSTHGR